VPHYFACIAPGFELFDSLLRILLPAGERDDPGTVMFEQVPGNGEAQS